MLLCPVRDCHGKLRRDGNRRVCEQGHSFDIARSGYTNLLQPQERRSKNPGDSAAAVAARRRLHDRGITQPLQDAIAKLLNVTAADTVLDAGCGDGFYLGSMANETGCTAHGIDISIPAIDAAARRYPACEWIVANADRFIPYADKSFSRIISITARMNPSEFCRVLKDDGCLLIGLPAPDDLVELRGESRDRVSRTVEAFAQEFKLLEQQRATIRADLEPESIEDVLLSIYRPRPTFSKNNIQVTFSLDLLLLVHV